MKRYLITENFTKYIIWEKRWWGWKCLKSSGDDFLSFTTVEAAEKHIRKINMLHGLYPIVKEVIFQ